MSPPVQAQLARLVVLPFATIGVLAALLMWELEHVGSVALALAITGSGMVVCVVVVRRFTAQIDALSAHYEALLRTAEEQSVRAETAGRIRDEFLATLSHELRTPLNSILGWARLLAGGKLDTVQAVRAVQAIERSGWAQSRLIEDLLDLSRIVGGRLQLATRPTLVQPLLEAVVQSLGPAASAKGQQVDTRLDPAIGPVTADPDRLRQIAWHLISNAIKFTPAGGRIDVRLGRTDSQICLSVTDTGVGFDPEIGPLLFERFRQGDSSSTRSFGGVGLGLGIVRHLVEMHGGTVAARSGGPQHGATFEVLLPLRPASAYDPATQATPSDLPLLRGISVLMVDDDPAALDFTQSSLERFGAVVVTARSAAEARARFEHDPPDVLLSDVRMPGEDGLQLIRDVRQIDARLGRLTPAAAVTALARTDDRRRALNAGFQMHLAKPIDPAELAATVQQLVRRT